MCNYFFYFGRILFFIKKKGRALHSKLLFVGFVKTPLMAPLQNQQIKGFPLQSLTQRAYPINKKGNLG